MPKATHTNTTLTPAPDVAPVTPTASINAPLLALAAEFQTVDARLMAINDEIMADTTGPLSMDKGEPAAVHDRWWAIVDRVIELPVHTQAGWAAKAAMIPPVIRDVSSAAIGTADINLALSLSRDMTGQAGPGAKQTPMTKFWRGRSSVGTSRCTPPWRSRRAPRQADRPSCGWSTPHCGMR